MNSARFRRRAPATIALAVALCGLGAGSLRGQTVTEFPLPEGTATPGCITGVAGDDHLWGADRGTNASQNGIAQIATNGDTTFTPIQGMTLGNGVILRLACVAPGPPADGAVWFTLTENAYGQIGRIATDGTVTLFPTLIQSRLDGIAAGPDAALWFTEGSAGKIGRITTQGTITNHYAIPTSSDYPQAIALGPDAALWFTERDGGRIGRITTSGVLTEYPIPTAGSSPQGITLGPDGALWFTESHANKIGRITTAGTISEFSVPTANAGPQVITSGPDGAVWFTENAADKIGRIDTGGSITEIAVPTFNAQPFGIAAGPDGNIWFTESRTNKIGQVKVEAPACGPGRGHVQTLPPASALPCLSNRS